MPLLPTDRFQPSLKTLAVFTLAEIRHFQMWILIRDISDIWTSKHTCESPLDCEGDTYRQWFNAGVLYFIEGTLYCMWKRHNIQELVIKPTSFTITLLTCTFSHTLSLYLCLSIQNLCLLLSLYFLLSLSLALSLFLALSFSLVLSLFLSLSLVLSLFLFPSVSCSLYFSLSLSLSLTLYFSLFLSLVLSLFLFPSVSCSLSISCSLCLFFSLSLVKSFK